MYANDVHFIINNRVSVFSCRLAAILNIDFWYYRLFLGIEIMLIQFSRKMLKIAFCSLILILSVVTAVSSDTTVRVNGTLTADLNKLSSGMQ